MKFASKILFTIALAVASLGAHAAVAFVMGYDSGSTTSDGIPVLGKNETVRVFFCQAKTKEEAKSCAMAKCKKVFGEYDPNPDCKPSGATNKKGYALAVVGPKGDNYHIFSGAFGRATKEEAWQKVEKTVPRNIATVVVDFYDDMGED